MERDELIDNVEKLEKEFNDWFMKLMFDKSHFPSCFWRDVIRHVKKPMKEYFIKEAIRFEAIIEEQNKQAREMNPPHVK